MNTKWNLSAPACADKHILLIPPLLLTSLHPLNTAETVILFFSTNDSSFCLSRKHCGKRSRGGNGSARCVWKREGARVIRQTFLFFSVFFTYLQTWGLSALCPCSHFPKEQLFVLAFYLWNWYSGPSSYPWIDRNTDKADFILSNCCMPLPGKDSMLRGCTTFPLAYSIRKMLRAEY